MSTREDFDDQSATLSDYVAILRRRKWIIIFVPLVSVVIAYALTARQSALYQAKASVYIKTSNLGGAIFGINPSPGDPTRLLSNQAKVATSDELAARVVEDAEVPGISAPAFMGAASATPEPDVDVLDLSVSWPTAEGAVKLANAYATDFARYKIELDTGSVQKALGNLQVAINRLRARGQTDSQAYDGLLTDRANLQIFGTLLANSARVQSLADGAEKVRPRPRRNAIIAGLLGLFLGLALAFLAEALDKRVRNEQEIEEALGVPLLGRLPRPPRALRKKNDIVMLRDPRSVHAQVFRKLRTSLEFVNFERRAETIMFTSGAPREGKSTTLANLAVALARAGRRVALVDLDLRRPVIHTLFAINGPGVTDVVVHRSDLQHALRAIALPSSDDGLLPAPPQGSNGSVGETSAVAQSNGRGRTDGVLHVLPAGTIPPAADELLESETVTKVLDELSREFDVVLVDVPPLLAVGDAQLLSAKVDAMVLVVRVGIHRRQLLEFARQVQNCRATVLGYVLTGASHGDSYTYGYGYDPHAYAAPDPAKEKVDSIEQQP